MTDPLIPKILYGLLATVIIGLVMLPITHYIGQKGRELTISGDKPSGNLAVSTLLWLIMMGMYFIGLIWYWFSLLAQVE